MQRFLVVSLVLAAVLTPSAGAADPRAADARLSCRREPGPGRVLCELEVEVPSGRLAWADALVTRSPEFARPLRARVGPNNAAGGTPRRLRLPLALGAVANGRGQLVVSARWVQCEGRGERELCAGRAREVSATVEVGAIEPGAR